MEILKNFLWALTFFAPRAISVLEQIIQLKGGLPTFHLDYRELEADGYLISVPGKGSFAAEARPLQEQKKQELFSKIRSLSQQAMALGATREELLAQIPTKEEEA